MSAAVDKKPGISDEDSKPVVKFTLKIKHQGRDIKVLVKPSTQFGKIFKSAYDSFNMEPGTLRFVYNGIRVRDIDTPADLEMGDDDEQPEIDAYVEQLGGAALHH